jgi:hypothetical protein
MFSFRSYGQLHTLSVLEQLREASKGLWGASSAAYFRVDELLRQLANPNLHDIPRNLPFRVEMWDQSEQHIRWVIAASASVAVGHAALDASRSAVHAEEWDTGDQAASENLARLLSLKSPGLIPQAGAFPLPIVDSTSSWVLISPISL